MKSLSCMYDFLWPKISYRTYSFTAASTRDNEEAADYLRTNIGQNGKTIEWVTNLELGDSNRLFFDSM